MPEVSTALFLGDKLINPIFNERFVGINSFSQPDTPQNPVTTDLVLELNTTSNSYPGSGSTWYDVSGNGYNFNQSGSATFNNGWNLNGSNQYLWNGGTSLPNEWSGSVTSSLTIFVDTDLKKTTGEQAMYGNWMASTQKILFEVNNGGTIESAINTTGGITGVFTSGTITTGRRIMAFTISGSTAFVFNNNVQVTGTGGMTGNWTTQTPNTFIGAREFPASTLFGPLSGSIKAVVAYNRALSSTERTAVYDYLLNL